MVRNWLTYPIVQHSSDCLMERLSTLKCWNVYLKKSLQLILELITRHMQTEHGISQTDPIDRPHTNYKFENQRRDLRLAIESNRDLFFQKSFKFI